MPTIPDPGSTALAKQTVGQLIERKSSLPFFDYYLRGLSLYDQALGRLKTKSQNSFSSFCLSSSVSVSEECLPTFRDLYSKSLPLEIDSGRSTSSHSYMDSSAILSRLSDSD